MERKKIEIVGKTQQVLQANVMRNCEKMSDPSRIQFCASTALSVSFSSQRVMPFSNGDVKKHAQIKNIRRGSKNGMDNHNRSYRIKQNKFVI